MKPILCVLMLALPLSVSCVPKPTALTPQAQTAYTADQILKRVGELQQAAMDASDLNKIKVEDARTIVFWTRSVIKALGDTPNGWQAVALATWPDVRTVVLANPTLAPYVPLVDGMLNGGK